MGRIRWSILNGGTGTSDSFFIITLQLPHWQLQETGLMAYLLFRLHN